MEIIDTDVLIIGSGIAGLRAALEVSRNGKRALLVSKAPLGKANNTYLAGGMFAFAGDRTYLDKHIQKTLQSGRRLNDRKLVKKFAEEAPAMVEELKQMGMAGKSLKLGLVTRQSALIGGPKITPPLVRACRDAGVDSLEGVMVTDLVLDDHACCGAIGFHKRSGDIFGFRCSAVLIATGGAGAIYAQNDNAPGITGDGYVLAMKAGLELMDMEFVQFYPMVRAKGGQARMIVPAVLADLGKLTNKRGEDLKEKYNLKEKPIALTSRDRFARALFREISQGNGVQGGINLDLRDVEDSDIPFNEKTKEALRRNLSYEQNPIRIAPSCHHTMGGLAIDESGRTTLPGLFAAGEVVGAIHGANRMGGNALSESLVFGALAARSACEYADSKSISTQFKAFAEKILQENPFYWFELKSGPSKAPSLMEAVKQVLWHKVGIIRNKSSLGEAVRSLDEILAELGNVRANSPKGLLKLLECRNAALIGRAIAVSALERTESRGSHFREDFPEENKDWIKHIYVKMIQGKPQVTGIVPLNT